MGSVPGYVNRGRSVSYLLYSLYYEMLYLLEGPRICSSLLYLIVPLTRPRL